MSRLAIVAGINQYPGEELDYCVEDAKDFAEYLQLPDYGFDTVVLTDREATRYRILEELGKILTLDNPPDFFAFYFSGHGVVTGLGTYLVTGDARPFDEGVDLDQLSNIVGRIAERTPHCLVVLDCCHSGAGAVGEMRRPVRLSDIERGIATKTESRTLLAACRPEQLSFEYAELGHGIFTHAILLGLSGDAADSMGNVTIGGLYEFAASVVERESDSQITVMKGDHAGRVLLASGLTPRSRIVLPNEDMARLVGQGKQFLEDYTSQLNQSVDDWVSGGYRAACQALEPTIRWFENRRRDHPELKTGEFGKLYSVLVNRVKQLANVDAGTLTERGKVDMQVGSGGFGTVWRVLPHGEAEAPLAYKIYHPGEYGIDEKRKLFLRGYEAMRRLDHPRVVKVHGYTECPIGFYMNYVDGPSLRQLPTIIEEPGELLRFLILVGETIAHAHSRGVYHRDIKPENILATYRQEDHTWLPYLTDFDLAWFSQATRVTKDVWANLSYAAPEQLGNPRSNAAHRPQVDIYAFGQLAYFSVTGSDPVPVGLANNYKLLQERLAQWPVGEAAARFGSWYEICVKDDPDERYPKFQSAMDELVDIELSLRDWAKTAVSDDNVLLEIAFSLSGFGATKLSSYHEAFPSISGRTRVALEIVSRQQSATKNLLSIEAQLTLERVGLEGVSSNERARAILNGRIDEVLRAFAGARRRPGTHGSFETFVIIRDVSCDRQGIEYARRLLNLVIQSIER